MCEREGPRPARHPFARVLVALFAILIVARAAVEGWADETLPPDEAASVPLEAFVYQDAQGKERTALGKVLVTAADGGWLVLERDGRLTTVEPEQQRSRRALGQRFAPFTAAQLGASLTDELGAGWDIHATRHYVVAARTSKAYAQWCAALFERLYSAFHAYWSQRGFALREPEFPLIAIVLKDERDFAAYATREAGPDAATAKGYYNIGSNRMVLYDLAGLGGQAQPADVARRLAAAPLNVATVIHEATHQIAFNTGLHTRYADNPLWVTEGMAMYFETPDLQSRSGWKTVGAVNALRLRQFQASLDRRSPNALVGLLRSDARLTDAEQAGAAYAEAWALSYFLIKTHKDAYVAYLTKISRKPPLVWDDPQTRLNEFQQAFGADLVALEGEWLRYMRRLKP